MKISELKPGISQVQITDSGGTVRFSLSVVDILGVKGVAGFQDGKPPSKGKHLLLSPNVRNWIEQMKIVSDVH